MKNDKTIKAETVEYEKCICCKSTTAIPRELNIEYRSCYIEGAGQLCIICFKKIYG